MKYTVKKSGPFALSPQVVENKQAGDIVTIHDLGHATVLKEAGYCTEVKSDAGTIENKMLDAPKENKDELDAQRVVLIAEGDVIGLKLTKNMKPETMRTKIAAEKEKQSLEAGGEGNED